MNPQDVFHGKYRIIRRLGEGGFGAVYVAEHVRVPGPPFALKVLHRQLSGDPLFRERFFREVTVARTLSHPHIVTVRDCDVAPSGECYFTMDLVPGAALSAVLKREGALEWRRALAIVRQILEALAAAHARGVVHRDVKPDNAIVEAREDGREFVHVLDFGIAKLKGDAGRSRSLTGGGLLGTPNFIAPEQAAGSAVDERTDLYSTGAMLHLLLTGRPVFEAATAFGLVMRHVNDRPPPVRSVRPDLDLPEALERLVLRALEKTADARFPSAGAMIAEIDLIAAAGSGLVGPATIPPPPAAGREPLPSADRLEGATVDRYLVEERLGSGGFGFVYRAKHAFLGRTVALKVLMPEIASQPSVIERFRREALSATRFRHANAVEVHDFGTDRGILFLVMEHVPGETLRAILRREGALSPERAVTVADQVLAALAAAHAAGIVHRDLKPENVLLTPDGRAKVCDFGIALMLAEPGGVAPRITERDALLVTPAYAAPEVWRGEAVDGRTDLYALGVMLFEMIAGRRPFAGATLDRHAVAHMTEAPPPLVAARAEGSVPPGLGAVVARALAKAPAERFSHATEMREALQRAWAAAAPLPGTRGSQRLRPASGERAKSPSGERAVATDRARLMIRDRTDFLFATPSLAFGRSKPGPDGSPPNAVILRVLPCRTPELDPLNYRRTVELSAHHGEFVLRGGEVCLVDRSARGIALDGLRVPKEEPVPLPARFRLDLAGNSLAIEGRIARAPGEPPRPAALRLERLENATHHAYVWVIAEAEVGPLEGAIPVADEPELGASIANEGGRLLFVQPPAAARPLYIGETLRGRVATLSVGGLEPADMTLE